ncbi:MAG: Gfo/Idh/MocA family oxidoreductase [Candidatus Solibacter sp.]
MDEAPHRSPSRRSLLRAAAVPAFLYLKPQTVFGYQANSAIEIGMVGCGGRGVYIGNFFLEEPNVRLVAIADPIASQMDLLQNELKLASPRRYPGLNGYRELANSKLDAVVLESPPYFHPEQAAATVEAGKHLFLAKPIAVDVPGCLSIVETGKKARGRLSTWIDFQTRMRPLYREAVRRVHAGDIGAPVFAAVGYHNVPQPFHPNPSGSPLERRLRNWNLDRTLSGEIIVEQDIHMIDVANWFLDAHPLEAFGRMGLAGAERQGDCADFFSVQYTYPNGVIADFIGTRFADVYRDQVVRVQGTKGTVDSHYMGAVNIVGANPWKGAESDTTRLGAQTNVRDFLASIRAGKPIDNTAGGAQTNLTAILGRTSAYRKKSVTWDEMLRTGEKFDAKLKT